MKLEMDREESDWVVPWKLEQSLKCIFRVISTIGKFSIVDRHHYDLIGTENCGVKISIVQATENVENDNMIQTISLPNK